VGGDRARIEFASPPLTDLRDLAPRAHLRSVDTLGEETRPKTATECSGGG
jgi:hypothetical protein